MNMYLFEQVKCDHIVIEASRKQTFVMCQSSNFCSMPSSFFLVANDVFVLFTGAYSNLTKHLSCLSLSSPSCTVCSVANSVKSILFMTSSSLRMRTHLHLLAIFLVFSNVTIFGGVRVGARTLTLNCEEIGNRCFPSTTLLPFPQAYLYSSIRSRKQSSRYSQDLIATKAQRNQGVKCLLCDILSPRLLRPFATNEACIQIVAAAKNYPSLRRLFLGIKSTSLADTYKKSASTTILQKPSIRLDVLNCTIRGRFPHSDSVIHNKTLGCWLPQKFASRRKITSKCRRQWWTSAHVLVPCGMRAARELRETARDTKKFFARLQSVRATPHSAGLNLFSLALTGGRLLHLPASVCASADPSLSFLLVDENDSTASVSSLRAYPVSSNRTGGKTVASSSCVTLQLQDLMNAVAALLHTIPVYAVVDGNSRRLLPANFPSVSSSFPKSSFTQCSDEAVSDPKHLAGKNSLRYLKYLVRVHLRQLQLTPASGSSSKGLGLFFLSPSDAEQYLKHLRTQLLDPSSSSLSSRLEIAVFPLSTVYSLLLRPYPFFSEALEEGCPAAGARACTTETMMSWPRLLSQALFSLVVLPFTSRRRGSIEDGVVPTSTSDSVHKVQWRASEDAEARATRYILVPDAAELEDTVAESTATSFAGTPVYFISSNRLSQHGKSNVTSSHDLCSSALPFADELFPFRGGAPQKLYLSRTDAQRDLNEAEEGARQHVRDQKPSIMPSWMRDIYLGDRTEKQMKLCVISLERLLECFAHGLATATQKVASTEGCMSAKTAHQRQQREQHQSRIASYLNVVLIPSQASLRYCHTLLQQQSGRPYSKLHGTFTKLCSPFAQSLRLMRSMWTGKDNFAVENQSSTLVSTSGCDSDAKAPPIGDFLPEDA